MPLLFIITITMIICILPEVYMNIEELEINKFDTITASNVEWLWYPYIPCGKITVLQGDPGSGKSMFIIETIARLSKGQMLPDKVMREPINVIYQCSEDDIADTIKPRFDKANADCGRVAFIREDLRSLSLDDEIFRTAMINHDARLLVIDPFQAYIGESDLSSVSSMRRIMRKLGMWASSTNCAVVLVGHLTKKAHTKELYRGLGSIDIVALARSVLQVERSEENPKLRYLRHIKSSLSGLGSELTFTIDDDGKFKWITNEDAIEDCSLKEVKDSISKCKTEVAADLIIKYLSNGPMRSTEVYELVCSTGIGERTVKEAKNRIGIVSMRRNGVWYWSLPTKE